MCAYHAGWLAACRVSADFADAEERLGAKCVQHCACRHGTLGLLSEESNFWVSMRVEWDLVRRVGHSDRARQAVALLQSSSLSAHVAVKGSITPKQKVGDSYAVLLCTDGVGPIMAALRTCTAVVCSHLL